MIEYTFRIVGEYFDMSEIVTVNGATVTAGADSSGTVTHKGILIASENGADAFSGNINGIFTGNSSFKFSFPGVLNSNGSSLAGEVTLRISDVSDENNYFDIVYYKGRHQGHAVVKYGNQYRGARFEGTASDDKGLYIYNEKMMTYNSLLYHFFGQNNEPSNVMSLEWDENGVLKIMHTTFKGVKRELARFDGTEGNGNFNTDIKDEAEVRYGLPKIAFPNGYKISFISEVSGDRVSPVLFEEINGVSLADKILAPENMTLDADACALLGAETVIVNGTNDYKTAEDLGLGARFPYSVAFGSSFVVKKVKTFYATVPALNEYASTPFSYTYLGKTFNQTLTVVNAAPVVSLNVTETERFRLGGPNASSLTLRYTDVTATDLVDGTEGVTIKIYVKAPSSADFTEVADGSAFEPTEIGEYTIKYVAIDKDNIASDGTLRAIVVIDGKVPVITVEDIADTALIKSSITVPAATATDGGDENFPLDVTFKVVYKVNATDVTGEELNVAQGGKLTFDRAGTYVIVYYAIDADGNEIDKTFTVTVLPDTDRPVLTVEGGLDDVTATKGDQITVRSASATDEVDGNVNVTVKVAFGVTEITVTDGKFVAENEGVYTVTYIATDEAGNTIEKTYSITVADPAPAPLTPSEPKKKGCGRQTARDLAIILGSLFVVLGAALFIGKKFIRKK